VTGGMTFPVTTFTGYIYDLRKVPLLIGIFYGGYTIGIFLTILTLVYRLFLGGDGVIGSLLIYPAFFCITLFFRPRFKRYTLRQKLFLSSFLTGGLSFLKEFFGEWLGMAALFEDSSVNIFFVYYLMHVVTTCLVVYLIEKSIESIKMRMQIQQTEKMNVVGELTASIAHEIRNPMTVSRGFMQLLKEQTKDEKSKSYFDMAISEMDRAQVIISDYLAFAKPELEEIETIDLHSHIEHVLSITSPYAALHNVEIEVNFQPSLFIEGNPGKLTQCLVNLIKNAIEASSENGKVEIYTEEINKNIIIKIVDNGIGMDEIQVERLGTPFYSIKEKGTGLGLMVCYRIIEMMNGTIEIESEKGKGTCFSLILPVVTEKFLKKNPPA
jgi:two-component system sporulation sensor kinase B